MTAVKEAAKQSLVENFGVKEKEVIGIFESLESVADVMKVHHLYVAEHSKPKAPPATAFDPATVDQLSQMWLSSSLDLFKNHSNYAKNQTQARQEVQSLLGKAPQLTKEFKQSRLFTLFTDQLTLLHSLALYLNTDIQN